MPSETEQQTAIITVDGFEKWGEITVRPRTVSATMFTIAPKAEKLMGDDPNPGNYLRNAAFAIATAKYAIVEPADLVDQVLSSSDPDDIDFFYRFVAEYAEMNKDFLSAAQQKKPGEAIGIESASPSDTTETSSPPTIAG